MTDQRQSALEEAEAFVTAAIEDCDRAALDAALKDDPLRLPYVALASFLRAQRGLHQSAQQPISDAILRQSLATGIARHSAMLTKELAWKNVLMLASLLLGTALIGAAIGYWIKPPTSVAAGVAAGAQQCNDQQDGSRLCWIPVWTRLPHSN